jgi:plasmid stabilization system protein ParE
MSPHPDAGREFLRHTLATLAYRGGKALRGAPASFAAFRAGETSRTPLDILGHMGDLFDWAVSLARGEHTWRPAAPQSWDEQVERFFAALRQFDEILASDAPLGFTAEKLFQGPVADALTHVGQIAMLRRLAGAPVKGENYFKADIEAGRVGLEQAAARLEFD